MPDRYQKIGEILANARQEQKKNLTDVAETTKIMAKYLEAVEAGNPAKLPSEAYFTLFARSYAQYLGIDPKIFDEFRNAVAEPTAEGAASPPLEAVPVKPPVAPAQKQSSGLGIVALVVILIVVVGGGGYFAYKYWQGRPSTLSGVGTETTAPSENSAGAPEDQNAPDSGTSYPAYKTPENLILGMEVRQNQKGLVVIDGDTVLNREIIAGETQQWEARYRYQLAFAIPGGVDLTLNGVKLLMFPDHPGVTWEINQANYKRYFPTMADSLRYDSLQKTAAKPGMKKK